MKQPIIIWGGVDVNPALYGESRSKYTQPSDNTRDAKELGLIELAIRKKQPVVGVCRGAQLLCVANGGKLHQHTKPTTGQDHPIQTKDGNMFTDVSAGHHQIMIPSGNFVLYGWNPDDVLVFNEDGTSIPHKNTAEVVWYPDTHHLAIQPHPEWSNPNHPFVKWINNLMEHLGIDYTFN